MPTLALIAPCGGVGRSTLAAALATLAAREGRWSLLLEWDPQNLVALHFGAEQEPAEGLASCAAQARPWHQAALQADDGTLVLPFGALAANLLTRWERQMAEQPTWLQERLRELDRPADGWTFIDTPPATGPFTTQALAAADAALLVLRADRVSLALLERGLAMAGGKPVAVVINALDMARPLQADIAAAYRARLGDRLSPYAVHSDAMVSEAFARVVALQDHAPHSQVAHDLHGLMRWLQQRLHSAGAVPAPA
jgi:cellulose synthase operon protein YhjQ